MKIFITSTDTNVGKTIFSSWLCAHTKYDYFKPIQTGDDCDSATVKFLANVEVHQPAYKFKMPASPNIAASVEGEEIDFKKLVLPPSEMLIVEGAGGLMVPLNHEFFMIDLVKKFEIPTILVVSNKLGTINHTILSVNALNEKRVKLLGIVINGDVDNRVVDTIEHHTGARILAHIPTFKNLTNDTLLECKLTKQLLEVLV